MPSYAAFLGRQPHISIAEIAAALPDFTLTRIVNDTVALFETQETLDQDFHDTLGGTVILARQLTDAPLSLEDIPQLLIKELAQKRGKMTFSLRTINVPKGTVRKLYHRCKDALRTAGKPCRYIGNDKKPAVAVLLHDLELIEGKKGCELVIVREVEDDAELLWIGRTVGAQDVNWYSFRDMEKPVRDTGVGLLPPKLAQMLLNFGLFLARGSQPKPEPAPKRKKKDILTIFDPFCGTGVIPMESLLRGWHALASDLSLKAVNGCKKNLEWLRKEEKILKKDVSADVWKHDARKPFDLKNPPDVIVTETSLGPPLTARPPQKEVSKMKTESEKLQADFLKNAAETLPNVPIVCMWPAWKQKGGWVHLEKVWKVIADLGYTPVLPPHCEPASRERFSLFYSRPDQYVGREIVLLRPPRRK